MDTTTTDTFHLFGNIIRLISPSASNGGHLSVAECLTRPGAGAPPNRHAGDDECFYVLSGQYEFVLDGKAEVHGPGHLVKVPNGRPHHFTNVGSVNARMLIITWPGKGHDGFFSGVGEALPSGSVEFPAPKGPPDLQAIQAIKAIAQSNGIELMIGE